MDNTVNIDSVMQDKLEEKILELAKKVQDGTIEDNEVYTLIKKIMNNRLFSRELLVKTLEGYNKNPDITIENGDLGLDTTTIFNIIDAYDSLVALMERQEITKKLVGGIIQNIGIVNENISTKKGDGKIIQNIGIVNENISTKKGDGKIIPE